MKSLGYDMFNINDPFYQDLCTLYTSENNTDMPLSARKEYIYDNKDSKCQPNCHFSSYLPNSFYINCSCIIEKKEEKEAKEFSGKKLYESFYDVLVYANFKILGCYNNIVNIYIFKKNIGNYIIFVIFALYFICLIFFIRKGIFPLANKVKELISSFQKKNDYNNIIDLNIIQIQNKNNNDKINISNPKKKKHVKNKNVKDVNIIKPKKKIKKKIKTQKIDFTNIKHNISISSLNYFPQKENIKSKIKNWR